jgi:Glyoxalase superfamily protein
MSRPLPTRPNLEHLKKQAKELLDDWQRQNPDAQLADALHAVAREYGFASWPKLKVAVEESLQAAATARNPFIGVWTADVSRSTRHPANQFQRATLQFAVDGDTVTITDVVVNAAGQEDRGTNTILVDGVERGAGGGDGYALVARRRGPRIIETIARKSGAIVGRGTYEVSADGRTLTVSTSNASANADGWQTDFDQKIVLHREEDQEAK